MTQEEKAKAYDEAMNKIKPLYEQAKKDGNPIWSTYEYIFSELDENDDERIRKEIIEFIDWAESRGSVRNDWHQKKRPAEWIAYLERQKEEEGYEAIPVESTLEYKLGFKAGKESEKQKDSKWSPSEGEMGVLYKLCYISNQITDEDDTELTRLYQDLKREYFNGHSFENMFHSEKQKEETLRDFIDNFPYSCEEEEHTSAETELKIPDWVYGGWDDEYMINTVVGRYSLHAEVAKKHGDTHDYNLSKSMENWLRNVVKPLIIEKQKEQKHYWKPTETDVALFNKAVTTNKELTPSERAQLDIIRSKFGCCRAVNCNGIMQKEQKSECSNATINGEPIPTENQSVDIPLAERNPMKFKEGDKVIIHCAPERKEDIFSIYDGQEGTIDAIWDLDTNPWGNIKVTLPNGCNNTFYDSELELSNKNESKQEWNEEEAKKAAEDYADEYPGMTHENDGSTIEDYDKPYNDFLSGVLWAKHHGIFQNGNTQWKPNDEQMKALERASLNEYLSAKQYDILVSLHEQLKKL